MDMLIAGVYISVEFISQTSVYFTTLKEEVKYAFTRLRFKA